MTTRPLRPSPSPRIAELRSGEDIETFWREVQTRAPLVESDPTSPDTMLVTFVARETDRKVMLILNGAIDIDRRVHEDMSPHILDRFPGSDVHYATYRLPKGLRASYLFYRCHEVPRCDRGSWRKVIAGSEPDQLNRLAVKGPFEQDASLLELPHAPPMPYVAARSTVDAGHVSEHLQLGRHVWIYRPPGHSSKQEYPVVVLLDGKTWATTIPIAPTLDNLINDGKIPPMVAVLPDSGSSTVRWNNLACSQEHLGYLRDHVLPWAANEFGATRRGEHTIIAGQSLGGLAAAHAGLMSSQRFGNVICQSASLWWPHDDPQRLINQYAAAETAPIRFFVQAGSYEEKLGSVLDQFTAVLDKRGYRFTRSDYVGGHEYICWLAGLTDGLCELAGDW